MSDALEAKAEGMTRVADNANQKWMDYMLHHTRLAALELPQFTSDDVFDRVDADDNAEKPETHDYRAFGPVMMRAAKLGYCIKAQVAPVPSRRKSLHASPRAVWISLLHKAVA
jgi:hypothetical protein